MEEYIDTSHNGRASAFVRTAEKLLREGQAIRFSAGGNSMHPTIMMGDTLIIEPCEPVHLATGDIVLFKQENRLLAHRIVRIDGMAKHDALRFVLRGDFRSNPDPTVDGSRILGKIVSLERGDKLLSPYGCCKHCLAHGRRLISRVKSLLSF